MRNHPYGFEIYLVNVKTMRTIFVAFSEKLNFNFKMDEGTSMYVLRNHPKGGKGGQKKHDYVIHG